MDALAQLLSAYDADLEALRLQVEAAVEGSRAVSIATRSLPVKLADVPVGEQQDGLAKSAPPCEDEQSGFGAEVDAGDLAKPAWACGDERSGLGVEAYGCSEATEQTSRSESTPDAHGMLHRSSTSSLEHYRMHLGGLMRADMSNFASSICFETLSAAILVLFCLVTALDVQREGLLLGYELGWPRYRDPSETGWPAFGQGLCLVSYVCSALFSLEVVLRFLAMRAEFFYSVWNVLDVVLVLSSVVEIAFPLSMNIRILRLIRLFRLLRFAFLERFMKNVESLYFLMEALKASVRVLTWSCLLLCVVQIMMALFLTEVLFFFYFRNESAPQKDQELVFMYFGSFSRSLLTTFEMALGNWPTPARVLFENVSEWFGIVFIIHKVTVGFSVLGIINAVFVQETLSAATSNDVSMVLKKHRQMKTATEKLEKFFRAADASQDGRVSRQEFADLLALHDVKLWLSSMEYDAKDPDTLFDMLDKENGSDLSAEEFVKGMTALQGPAKAMDLLRLVGTIDEANGQATAKHFIGSTVPDPL